MKRHVNKVKRKDWCDEQIRHGEQFEDVIYTDESRIEICRTSGNCYKQDGHPTPYQPKLKHPYAVLLWAGISMRGANDFLIFTGKLKAPFYINKIIKD